MSQSKLIGTASKAITQFQEAQQKAEKDAYTNFVETSVQNAFAGNFDTETVNSPDFKSKFKDPADYDKVVRARSTTQVSDSDVYNKLLYRINSDPYGIKQDDIVSAEGISLQDKNKALEELQRNQEITGRPNYKAARELFDIDFKQKFGEDLSIDPAEEKAKWLRVFNSYIIDKKMEPLDAAEKVRKNYEPQNYPPLDPSQDGDITSSSQQGKIANTPLQEFDETDPLEGGVGKSTTKHHQGEVRNPKFNPQSEIQNHKSEIDPTDSLFVGMGKSIVQGATAFPRTFWGTLATMEDITKSIPETMPYAVITQFAPEDFFKRRYEDVKGIEERFQAKGEGYKKYVNGAIRTMSEMLSQYAGTAGLGTLLSMSAGAGVDKYLESRKEGYSIPRSFAAGGVTATTEYVTEKSPLAILGRPGLKFVDRLMKGLIADVPGEIEAILVEMTTVDQAILGKSHTRQEYLGALLYTVATAALTTLGSTGVTHPFTGGETQQMPGGREAKQPQAEQAQQTPEAQTAQQTQQAPEIKQSAKEEVPGVKPEEYASAQQTQTESFKDYNEFLVKREEQGGLAKTTKLQREQLIAAYNEFPTGKEFVTDLGEKISFVPPEGKSKEEYIHHFLTKFSPGKKKEFYSGRYLELVREIPDTIKNYDERILGEINGQDRIYYTREFPGTAKTPHHVLVVSVDANGKFVGWTHFEAKENYKQKLLKTEKEVIVKRGLIDAEGNKAEVSYEEYNDRKRSALFYLGNNALSGLPQSQGSLSGLKGIIPPSSEIVKHESVKPIAGTVHPAEESVKPDIQLMPSLKGLVGTGRLSIEDALEIDDVARQNNWSDETVKQFHKSAVEGLGIRNKDTAALEQMLVTAKVKSAAYKQNAEKYKQVVGKNIERVRRWRNALNNEGYQVYLHLIDLSPEKATRRAVERFQNTGRFVDPNYVLNLGLIPSKNYDILKQEKGWVGYEKYSTDVERGQPPALIERGGELFADAGRPLRLSRRGLSQGIGEDSQGKTKESSTAEVVPPRK